MSFFRMVDRSTHRLTVLLTYMMLVLLILQEVKQRILLGTFSLSAGYSDAYYQKSQQLRSILSKSFAASFEAADVLVCPTSPTVSSSLCVVWF